MKKAITFMLTLVLSILGMTLHAQAPQTGVYRIQNVGGKNYIKVTGKYDAQLVSSQSEASYITVGIEKKLSDGTYKVNSLASTYGDENTPVEVYDYLTKALTLGEIELGRELAGSSEANVQKAINRMHELAKQYGYMRMMPVDGQADTYHAIAVLPYIPKDIVDVWVAKKNPNNDYTSPNTGGHTMWDWCIDIVYRYLAEHSGTGGTNAALASKISNNLKNIKEGHTYMLTGDDDKTFGYVEIGKTSELTNATLVSNNRHTYWKLYPKANVENMNDGTYKIHNLGKDTWVRIRSKYYATPDADEADADNIRITFNGKNEIGDQKITNLGGKAPDGTDIDIYNYIEKAIMLGKTAISIVLNGENGSRPASPENVALAKEFMETFIKDNAFMSIKPVKDIDGVEDKDAAYAYAIIPEIPPRVVEAMAEHIPSIKNAENQAKACWDYGVEYVKQYLRGDVQGTNGETDNTLKTYILANIDLIRPGVTYYLGAETGNGTFDYYPKFENGAEPVAGKNYFDDIKADPYYMWGVDVEEVEEENLTSGTYKIRNVYYACDNQNYVEVLEKYYAKPDTDEEGASEIHITFDGKLDDGSYKVSNMEAVAKDGSQVNLLSYVDKAVMMGRAAIAAVLSGDTQGVNQASGENIEFAQDYMEEFVRANTYFRVKPVVGKNYVYAIGTIPEIPDTVVQQMAAHISTVQTAEDCWQYGVNYVLNMLKDNTSTLASYVRNNITKIHPGNTYYLSEDPDHTFGLVNAIGVDLDDPTIQWGIDLVEEDQPIESEFYKIHNVGTDKYVHVESMYYAKVNADEESATPIQVTIGEQLEDGSYKVTNLVGDGKNVWSYVQHAIELGEGLIDKLLKGKSTQEHINEAKARMREFIEANAYMRIRKVPGQDSAYYAYATAPVIPDDITREWRKKNPTYEGDMWQWCVEQVEDYLTNDNPGTNSTLTSLVLNNIRNIKEGHTYYLSAEDGNDTFDYADATEVDLQDTHFWWGFADAVKGDPANGYFRIKNAIGDYYVNVTGPFAAQPNKSQEQAMELPGTVIYVGMDEKATGDAFRVTTLRSQGVDAHAYFDAITTVIDEIAKTGAEMVANKVAQTQYKQYAGLVAPAVQMLRDGIDVNAYAEPTLTSEGKDAYMLKATVPDLGEYCDLAMMALGVVGISQQALADSLQSSANKSTSEMGKLFYGLAAKVARHLHEPQVMWNLAVSKLTDPESEYYGIISALGLPEEMVAKGLNTLKKINYGTTYCLSHQSDNSFDLVARDDAKNDDACKWILEPAEQLIISTVQNHNNDAQIEESLDNATSATFKDGQGYTWTTLYTDFDMELASGDKAYKVTAFKQIQYVDPVSNQTSNFYICETTDAGSTVPAQTPVLLRTKYNKFQLAIPQPETAPDTTTAISSKDYVKKILGIMNYVDALRGAPRRVSTSATDDNYLVGTFFDEEGASRSLYALGEGESQYNQPQQMQGLGFWVQNSPNNLKGNQAYLDASKDEEYYFPGTTISNNDKTLAVGYILSYVDGENTFVTEIDNVNASKQIANVKYYNIAGIESNVPFSGVNIVVTTFTDGTKVSSKIVK